MFAYLPPAPEANTFGATLWSVRRREEPMSDTTLDVREIPPADRHPKIHDAFDSLDSGEELVIVNDHEPKPLFYEMQAEVEAFDADGYEVERRGSEEFVARFPKR